ncbi:MAG: response regulator transcription factor [Gammaproteobacteria bacterium]|nr:response regulator transcription factor [Gammaproteobacteria bacterium]
MGNTIAIVEDDPRQREHYADALRRSGYRVTEYENRAQAIASFETELPDLAILDIILGSEVGGGFEVCRYLKQRSVQLPVIFLTTRGDELDKIYGLQLGAWDYQTKPVSLEYLVTRVESLFSIKDGGNSRSSTVTHIGEMEMNPSSMQARWKNKPVELTPTEFDILSALLASTEGVSIEELVSVTRQGIVEDNTINTHILHIRKKFKKVDPDFDCIKTRYGFGYSWICR